MGGGPGGLVLEADAIIGERYRLRRALGEGGMGFVWEANHVFTHKPFALKFLKGARAEDRRRFIREVRAAAAVKHPNVIGVHDFVELTSGTLVMVMDLLRGETLGGILKREGRIAIGSLAAMLLPVVSALEAAHREGIVHRDLKPDNIFMSETDDGAIVVKVLDFGVAKLTALEGLAARTQALTGTGSLVGTPYYMSPEQVVAEKDLDARADIWSLGVVMYECLAGERPTEADNVGRVLKRIILADFEPIAARCPEVPEDVAALVTKMLVGDRDNRVRDLQDVRIVLERHASEHIPASLRVPGADEADIDAHADTVSASSADGGSRAETNQAVTVAPQASSRVRPRRIAAAVVVAAGAVSLAGFGFASRMSVSERTVPVAMPAVSSLLADDKAASATTPSATPAIPVASRPSAIATEVPSGAPSAPASAPAPSATARARNAPARPVVATSGASLGVSAATPAASAVVAIAAALPVAPAPAASSAPPMPPAGFAASRKE